MDKKQLSEEDVKRLFITPAIEAQWHKDHIRMEAKITDGRMNIKGNLAVRNTPKISGLSALYGKRSPHRRGGGEGQQPLRFLRHAAGEGIRRHDGFEIRVQFQRRRLSGI